MSAKYHMVDIFTSEEARYEGFPLSDKVVAYIQSLKIAARCIVIRGVEGCYENGEISTQNILDISLNMPIQIKIILPSAQIDIVLPALEKMISEGIMTANEINIFCHKTQKRLIPRHLKVKDIMTFQPKVVQTDTPVSEVVNILLSSTFTGVPVVDKNNKPLGVISQGDLIYRAGMPVRLGILAEAGTENLNEVLSKLSAKNAKDIMSKPPVSIHEDKQLTEAVNIMLTKGLKRLPVINDQGKLTGILSRMDIFHTISSETPDWNAIRKQNILVGNLKLVSDIMRRDVHTVLNDAPVKEVLSIIDSNDIQRVAVVDKDGHFLGMISDRNLLSAFYDHRIGFWGYLTTKFILGEKERLNEDLKKHLNNKIASEVMKVNTITILESATIDEAIRLITGKKIKRLPVLDLNGKFKGMISRESLLRTGFLSS
ncbi:MAG: DUF190 domain-containing protein [Desulfobacterales bacterium]|nr:DUF190 domain-containing protein [Desulfobacterales bacterium]MBF0395595.1 DUF190 domain-containing protein [Desulfobacterales bacterium]